MMEFDFKKYVFHFKNEIGTSRGKMRTRTSWFIFLKENDKIGIGEVAPLPGLSIETESEVESELNRLKFLNSNFSSTLPSIIFALETALLDLQNGGKRILFHSPFTNQNVGIPINGLIWMNDFDKMKSEIDSKINIYKCIKIKIGSINFEDEIELIKYIRNKSADVEIRLDANGAFDFNSAKEILNRISKYKIHSIEQPIAKNQIENLKVLCETSPIPIALDEELIGVNDFESKLKLIDFVKPHYLVLKPSLLGGFKSCDEWIEIAEKNNVSWWITSALESNIGLNSIAEWTATLKNNSIHGLGTGELYKNNFTSPLSIKNDKLFFNPNNNWDLTELLK